MKILVTGGAGFIGSNFIKYLAKKYPDYFIFNIDKLTYAGNLENLKEFHESNKGGAQNYKFIKGDICDEKIIGDIISSGIDAIINFAAESHVDRSIIGPSPFIETNIKGTHILLESAIKGNVKRFIQISTDEVYGSLGESGVFTEDSPLLPNSPYSASKAGADLLVRSYFNTYGLPLIITRSSNNYGPYQFPEKLIPLIITNALEEQYLPIYGDGLYVRDWIYVEDHCSALDLVLHYGKEGEIYNIGGNCEMTNLEITKIILNILNKPHSLIKFVEDRQGHDRRYALDTAKIKREMGWTPKYKFEDGIKKVIKWYEENREWWMKVRSGEYQDYYKMMYEKRLKEGKGEI